MLDRDDDRTDLDRDLARLAAATSELTADDGFADAVLRAAASAEDPLARAARVTADLEPDVGFTDAVLEAARSAPQATRAAFGEGIVRSGRFVIVAAALAAAASVVFSIRAQSQVDTAIMASVDAVEVSE